MRQRNRLNLALLVGVVALAAVTTYQLMRERGPAPLTDVDPRSVERLRLEWPRADSERVAFERRRDGWHLTQPIERSARDGRIVSALAVLAARSDACYPTTQHELGQFGLATPRLRAITGAATLAFGNRAADGRRYVRAGERFCLLADRSYPLLQQGVGLANLNLLETGATPTRIATPAAQARRRDDGSGWKFLAGSGDAPSWAARWRAAQAAGVTLDPPAAERGRVHVATADGRIYTWRIAAREPKLILVAPDAAYGLTVPRERAEALLQPPAES
jgi:hypothetical protein